MNEVESAVGFARLRSDMLRRGMAPKMQVQMLLGGAPATKVKMEPSEAAQPHVNAVGSEDAPRLGRGAGPEPRCRRTAR